ncbi:MAG: hypothetical protein HC933_10535 [Pleurocapsa sp. SU_196_0]|nr:hypothetical protein [Pleurocapsa sp. SU_196_0]
MNPSIHTTRRRLSWGLCLLGGALPLLVMVSLKIRYLEMIDLPSWTFGINHQWLPFTGLLWLGAAYAWPDSRLRFWRWVVCLAGWLFSFAWYLVVLRLSQ